MVRFSIILLISVFTLSCERTPNGGGLAIPPPGFLGDAAQGQRLYQSYCERCHGMQGTGSSLGPPLVNKIYAPNHHADLSFYMAVSKGVKRHHWTFGDMPAITDLNPKQTAHIVKYIRNKQQMAGIF